MKYEVTVEIEAPRDRVIELFDNSENLAKWQPSLLDFEHLSGNPGEKGATSKLRYQMGKKEITMVETIVKNDFPSSFVATYEAKGVWNEVVNTFVEDESGKTSWNMTNEFQCKGIMRVLSFLMPGMFKKETLKQMNHFKSFVESTPSES